ncbi:hypothetical protein, partial [Caballeronia sp. BR00000012568055]|uniref:hypothetical protein n=1 Tax=Caballeronia sp. BR00000012568055 TaxID=2918761 RepID=UPI0023F871FA
MMAFHDTPVRPFVESAASGADTGSLLRALLSCRRTPTTLTMFCVGNRFLSALESKFDLNSEVQKRKEGVLHGRISR